MGRATGFRFAERMRGSYSMLCDPEVERPFEFRLDVISPDLRAMLRDGRAQATGQIEAPGMTRHAPVEGFLVIQPLRARRIRYELDFVGDEGALYHYVGEKTIRHLHPVRSWTTLPGVIRDADDKEIARSVVTFDVRETLPFLWSFRLTREVR